MEKERIISKIEEIRDINMMLREWSFATDKEDGIVQAHLAIVDNLLADVKHIIAEVKEDD